MSLTFTLTDRDFLVGRVVDPAWYVVFVEDYELAQSKDGGSMNCVLKAQVVANADTGDTTFAGVPLPRWAFNSKAPGFAIPLFKSLGVALKPGETINWPGIKGQKVVIWIGNKEYEGRNVNDLGSAPKYRMADGSSVQ